MNEADGREKESFSVENRRASAKRYGEVRPLQPQPCAFEQNGRSRGCNCRRTSTAATIITFFAAFSLLRGHNYASAFSYRSSEGGWRPRRDVPLCYTSLDGRNSNRQLQLSSPSHRSMSLARMNYDKTHQEANCWEKGQVHDWLLQSTAHVLGGNLTYDLLCVGGDCGASSFGCASMLPRQFPTKEKFVLNAESVMGAWCQWISRFSADSKGGPHPPIEEGIYGTGSTIRCSMSDAASVIDVILEKIIEAIGEPRFHEGREGLEGPLGENAQWGATKVVKLVNMAIDSWANSEIGDGQAVNRTGDWLDYLGQKLRQWDSDFLESDRVGVETSEDLPLHLTLRKDVAKLYEESHRGVIKACIRSHNHKNLEKALGLLDYLKTHSNVDLRPTTQTYNLVLYGLANDPCIENAQHAEKLLGEICDNGCDPDPNTFRQVVIAWTKSGSNKSSLNARRILDVMLSDHPTVDPDASTFNAMMTLLLKQGEDEEALALFDMMASMHRSGRDGTQPDMYSVNLMLKAITRQPPFRSLAEMEAAEELLLEGIQQRYQVRPDRQSYNIVLDAWAKSRLRQCAARAEMLLERMCLDQDISPDAYSFTSMINAIKNLRHHRARGAWAEKVFHQMRDMHLRGLVDEPTAPVYNALINTLISSKEDGWLERVESLFSEMDAAGIANTRTANTILKGYSEISRNRIGGKITSFSRPRKAEALLYRMELSYSKFGMASAYVPDKYSYTSAISAYARSRAKRKAAKASLLLQRMIDSYIEGNLSAKPGTYAFNAVLKACAHTRFPEERLEGFTILCSTLVLLRDWARPDHTTYGTFLLACARLLPREEAQKWRVVEAVFESCIREGQCCDLVLRNLKGVASPELYEALVGRFLTEDGLDVPLRWRRNVPNLKSS